MKKTLIAMLFTAAALAACNTRGDSDTSRDDKDTINAGQLNNVRQQQELNADTSANSSGDPDNSSTKRDSNGTQP